MSPNFVPIGSVLRQNIKFIGMPQEETGDTYPRTKPRGNMSPNSGPPANLFKARQLVEAPDGELVGHA